MDIKLNKHHIAKVCCKCHQVKFVQKRFEAYSMAMFITARLQIKG